MQLNYNVCLEKNPEEFTQVEGFNPTFVSFGEMVSWFHLGFQKYKNTTNMKKNMETQVN